MTGRKDRKWRNYLLHHDLQLRMISYSAIYMVVMLTITCVLMVYPLLQDMLLAEQIEVQYRAAQNVLTLMRGLIPAVVLLFILFFIHQVLITHRICGPLINFSHTFEKVGRGDLTRKVYLRQQDHLKLESQRINTMVEGLTGRVQQIKKDGDRLLHLLEQAAADIESIGSRQHFETTLNTLKSEARQLTADLSKFKLPE
jgi:methyl-accepting chemotaxis protein